MRSARWLWSTFAAVTCVACAAGDEPLPGAAAGPSSSGAGGGSSSSTGVGGTDAPPFVSGTGSLQLAWRNGLPCTGVYAAGLRDLWLGASGDVLVGGTVDGKCSLFGAAEMQTGGKDLIAARL